MNGEDKILLVDDEPNVLAGLKRQLRKQFTVTTATSGQEALDLVKGEPPFSVIVCDMRMPGMNGIEVLEQMQRIAPDTTRMMLTGNADQQTAIDAVNEGSVFRFFTKPCPAEILAKGIEAGTRQYHLVTAEKELLEKTLAGSVKILVDVLSVSNPEAFGQACRVREWMLKVARDLKLPRSWELEMTAMLSTIGQVAVPLELMEKHRAGKRLTDVELDIVTSTPEVARHLIENIPRLKQISDAVYCQNKGYDGSGFPDNDMAGQQIPLGARLLRILNDLATNSVGPTPTREAFVKLNDEKNLYDPQLLADVRTYFQDKAEDNGGMKRKVLELPVSMLLIGDILKSDLENDYGNLYLSAGHTISPMHIEHIRNLNKLATFKEPVKVLRFVVA